MHLVRRAVCCGPAAEHSLHLAFCSGNGHPLSPLGGYLIRKRPGHVHHYTAYTVGGERDDGKLFNGLLARAGEGMHRGNNAGTWN